MIRFLAALLAATAVSGAGATESGTDAEGGVPALPAGAGEHFLPGGALDLIATRDSDKFERNIVRLGAMLQYESSYDFIAVGASSDLFRQGDWSLRATSLMAAIRKVERATAAGFTARAALTIKGSRQEFHGEGIWNIRFSSRTGAELIANRDAVETVQALTSGIMSNFFAASLDHAFTERLTAIAMPTYRHFSDGNRQTGLRGWVIYTIVPEYGLSLNVKARAYDSSQSGAGAYFSPERYERAEIGLRLRHAAGDWRVYATADVGRERINGEAEKPTYQVALTGQRAFANDVALGLQLASYRTSDSVNYTAASDRYSWRMVRAFVTIPF